MSRTSVAVASALFFLVGPGLEAGVGPWLLTRWEVADGLPSGPVVTAAGVALIAGGLAVLVHAYARFALDGAGTPSPAAPPGRLVVTGAYRHVRNPMYVATAAVIVGQALMLSQSILLVAAAAYCLALAGLARFVEAPRLRRRFGPAYEAYERAVPGWLPRPWSGRRRRTP